MFVVIKSAPAEEHRTVARPAEFEAFQMDVVAAAYLHQVGPVEDRDADFILPGCKTAGDHPCQMPCFGVDVILARPVHLAEQIVCVKDDIDLVIFETFGDLYELKAGVLAAKENCDKPVFVSVSFDKSVVFYEDAYTNAPNDVVAKHSTNTTLTVFAYGGDAGGMLYVSAQKIEKLVRVGGKSISFPYTAFVPPQSGVSFSIEYEAAECSDSINDISVSAMIVSCDGGSSVSDSDTTTSVKVRITACRQFPSFRRRHRYGICEDIWCEWFPKSAVIDWAHSGEGHWAEIWPTYRRFVFPQGPCTPVLTASHGDASYDIDLTCVAPNSIDAKFDNYMVATPPTAGKSGLVGMLLQLTLMPTNVSFEGLYVEEIPTTTGTHTGYFNVPAFSNWWHHTRANGAGNWHLTGIDNIFAVDEAVMQEECLPPWSNGEITWQIPVEWAFSSTNTAGTGTLFYSAVQQFLIDTEGTVSVEKFKYILSRSTNDVFSLKKRMSK